MGLLNLSKSDVLRHMEQGATLHKGVGGDTIKLRIPNTGTASVPAGIFDRLVAQGRLVQLDTSGYYRLP